jgi:hypothetical protein
MSSSGKLTPTLKSCVGPRVPKLRERLRPEQVRGSVRFVIVEGQGRCKGRVLLNCGTSCESVSCALSFFGGRLGAAYLD